MSRIFDALSNEIASTSRLRRGGRGLKNPTSVMRVPVDCLEDFDLLIDSWKQKASDSPTSPRYEKLREFLSELESLFPSS